MRLNRLSYISILELSTEIKLDDAFFLVRRLTCMYVQLKYISQELYLIINDAFI